mmetsp:Transcript_93298/g.165080  ORF Transcript_93298/g.165080 Transcript_93298/m.165080 type:complete len:241 (-) Transcript_93298:186-908(-)
MAHQMESVENIPIQAQHDFLDLAKGFQWDEVKRCVNDNPSLVGVQPSGREGKVRWSALHQAAYSGDVDAVQFLLYNHAPVAAQTADGKIPYEIAKNAKVRSILEKFAPGMNHTEVASMSSQKVSTPLKATLKKVSKGLGIMKVMKTSKRKIAKGKGAKRLVYKGKFEKTVGGLTKDQLTKSKAGKIVSKRMQARGKIAYLNIKSWVTAFMKARTELGLSGFVPVKKGLPLYAKTNELYRS